jgi:YVTN family beta-propeller protein
VQLPAGRIRHPFHTLALTLSLAAACSRSPTSALATFTHPQGTIFDSVAVSARPFGLAVAPSGVLYVARLDTDTLGRADLPSTAVAARAVVGTTPSHVAFNPSATRVYSSNQGTQDISVVDVADNRQVAAVPVSSDAWNVIVSPDGARVWATTDQGHLYAISTATNAVVDSLTLRQGDALRGLAMDPTGRWLFVGGCLSGSVYVVDTRVPALGRTLAVGGMPQHLAVSRDGSQLYVADEANGLDMVTLSSGAVRTITLAGGGYGLALSPDDAQLYVTIPSVGLVQVVDRATGSVQATLRVGGKPRGVAFTRDGAIAAIANEFGYVTYVN